MYRDYHKIVKKVSFANISVRETLTRMKTFSELMLDLAYSAILFSSQELIEYVMELEEDVDNLSYQLLMSLSLAVRDKDDAEQAVGLFRVAASVDKISNAAADLAVYIQGDEQVHPLIQDVFRYVEEYLVKATVSKTSNLIELSIEDLWDKHDINVDVIAIRRNRHWTVNPDKNWTFEENDVIFVRGSSNATGNVVKMATGVESPAAPADGAEPESSFERLLLDIKETSEFMVSLAFAAVKYQDTELADEVRELEDKIDKMCSIALKEVLTLKDQDINRKAVLIGFVLTSEKVADAAWEMAAVLLSGLETHPIIAAVVDEAEEIVSRVSLHPQSTLVEKTLAELSLDDNFGIWVLSIKRGEHWFHRPSSDFRLQPGDVLIFDGYKEWLAEFRQVACLTNNQSEY